MATTSRRAQGMRGARSRNGAGPASRIQGPVRMGTRTKDLVKHLKAGEIALINHQNLDRIAAEDLAARDVLAVINVASSSDGSYPNRGPLALVQAGVVLVDAEGSDLFDRLQDGDRVELDGGQVILGEETLAEGVLLEADELASRLDEQRRRIDGALHDFAENTVAHIREESELLSGTIEYPDTRTKFRDRHVLICVRGTDHVKDLRALRAYVRDVHPILVAVDGAAHAMLDEGMKPDMILGDMDSAGDDALGCGAELVVHGYADGRAPGADRLTELGLDHLVIPAAGTSQDVAMLLAYEKGATLIVTVGAQFNLVEFLDKRRGGMSSTFLTRLRIGELLVDAKGVSRLYNPGPSLAQMSWFIGAFVILLAIVVLVTPGLSEVSDLVWLKIKVLLGL